MGRSMSRSSSRSHERRRRRSRSRGRREDRRSSTQPQSLLVRGLPTETTSEELRKAFSRREGDIRDVYIPKDHNTGEPRGFAFIEFLDIREAREVKKEMDRSEFNGVEIGVLFAQERRKTPDQMRKQEQGASPARRSKGGRSRSRSRERRRRSPSRSYSRDRKRRSRRSSSGSPNKRNSSSD
ncbi:hypothetical protein THRCLA_21824 [Thraustotheca clavata]|uniref:RRM domain-containing protein n=1 Tax=Thraustotheca clavata TaxID=74557 RepID=A0A1V9ZNG3_9STRA|nr:hypothetical protein THRCLA_21824 [Thraustotheca clavata]